jgi:hypothetical protein
VIQTRDKSITEAGYAGIAFKNGTSSNIVGVQMERFIATNAENLWDNYYSHPRRINDGKTKQTGGYVPHYTALTNPPSRFPKCKDRLGKCN